MLVSISDFIRTKLLNSGLVLEFFCFLFPGFR